MTPARRCHVRIFVLVPAVVLAVACSRDQGNRESPAVAAKAPPPPGKSDRATAERPVAAATKIKLKSGNGSEAMSFKPKDNGAKVVDAAGAEIARLTIKGDKLKIKGPDDTVLGYIGGELDKLKIKGPDMEAELYSFKRADDGDYKLKDAGGTLLYQAKKRDYGFEIHNADGVELYKVKIKDTVTDTNDQKVSLRGPGDRTVYSTHAPVAALAMACLGFDKLSMAHRAALFWRVQSLAGGTP